MKKPNLEFPSLTRRQRDLLKELKDEIEKLKTPSSTDPIAGTGTPEFFKIRKRVDELSVRVLRFALKPLPAETRRPGFLLEAHYCGGRLWHVNQELKPGFGIFHPDLPTWAKDHLVEWIRMLKLRRADARDVLRETGIISIETGVKPPEDSAKIERWELIKRRVLELRGVKGEDFGDGETMSVRLSSAAQNEIPPKTVAEMLEELRKKRAVTEEMLKKAKHQTIAPRKKRKWTRKDYATWDYVIDKLVEEGLLSKKISRQALKGKLKSYHPDYPWDKV